MAKIRVSKDEFFMAVQSVATITCNVISRLGGTVDAIEAPDEDSAVIEFRGLEGSLDLRDQLKARGLDALFVGNG